MPRPFHGALVWLGKRLRPVGRAFHSVARHFPGGSLGLWFLLALVVVALCATGAGYVAKRQGGRRVERESARSAAHRLDPAALEREADRAETEGRAEAALRLRFRAGLLRLGRARVLPLRDSLTSGEARRLLRLAEFDSLAQIHDEVVFGGRPARREDATAAREGWHRVLAAKQVRS